MDITKEEYDELIDNLQALKIHVLHLEDIVEDSISSYNILENAVATDNIQNYAITGDKIVVSAITTDKLSAGAITAAKIAVGTITADQIEDGTITADKILAGTITSLQIDAGTIKASNIEAGTITTTQIKAGTIVGGDLAAENLGAIKATLGTVSAGVITASTISGTRLKVGGGVDEDIYFEDSLVRMYDFLSGNNKGLTWKYSTTNFAYLTYNPTTDVTLFTLAASTTEWIRLLTDETNNYFYLEGHHDSGTAYNVRLYLNPVGAGCDFKLHGTGQIQMPNLGSDPTSNNTTGCLCSVSGTLKYYDGSNWKTVTVT